MKYKKGLLKVAHDLDILHDENHLTFISLVIILCIINNECVTWNQIKWYTQYSERTIRIVLCRLRRQKVISSDDKIYFESVGEPNETLALLVEFALYAMVGGGEIRRIIVGDEPTYSEPNKITSINDRIKNRWENLRKEISI